MTGAKTAHFSRAIVVSDSDLEEARRVAAFFRAIGVLREAFSDPDEAARWDQEMAKLFDQQPPQT